MACALSPAGPAVDEISQNRNALLTRGAVASAVSAAGCGPTQGGGAPTPAAAPASGDGARRQVVG
jgi:hypothetical protein